jgi:hypothetical protein
MIIKDVHWSDLDAASIRSMLAEAEAEAGEFTLDEVVRILDQIIGSASDARVTRKTPDQA